MQNENAVGLEQVYCNREDLHADLADDRVVGMKVPLTWLCPQRVYKHAALHLRGHCIIPA